jgi:hypothetical protein
MLRPTCTIDATRSLTVSAPRNSIHDYSTFQWAELGTFLARAALAGFAVFLLALASHGA